MATRKGSTQPVALEMLIADHRLVKDLFDRYEDEKESDEHTRRGIAERICNELTVHARLEEELFYPWLRENLPGEDMEMVAEAEIEHGTAKELIEQLEDADEVDVAYDAKVKVLGEYIDHHVGEEEDEIFPRVRAKKKELDALGQEMTARRLELMDEIGISEVSGTPPAARAETKAGLRR